MIVIIHPNNDRRVHQLSKEQWSEALQSLCHVIVQPMEDWHFVRLDLPNGAVCDVTWCTHTPEEVVRFLFLEQVVPSCRRDVLLRGS